MNNGGEDFASLLGLYRERAGLSLQDLAYKVGVHRNTIVKWENRTLRPTLRGQVLLLGDELFLTKDERKAFIQAAGFSVEWWPVEVWNVPQQQNMFFTGRKDVLHSLRQLLIPGNVAALTQALSGLGGIGKTATAIEYAYHFRTLYETVLWIQADTWALLASECVKLAYELGLPERDEEDQNRIIEAVKCWLRKHRHWLLILDNLEDSQLLSQFVPADHKGSILITTQVQDIEPLAQTQLLTTMSESEGILFLLRRTKMLARDADLKDASPEQYHEARQIWQEMDGLPLALDQAGAYILETKCSFASYREQYAHRRKELLQRRGKRYIGHEMSIATTFSLALERVEKINPIAADILRTCSMLHAEAIPEEIFQEGAAYLGPRLAANTDGWDEAVGTLCDYSLVQRSAESRTLTVHRLVQAVLRDAIPAEETRLWAERTVLAMSEACPSVEFATWPQWERYLPHALVCAEEIDQEDLIFPEAALLLNRAGSYLNDRARYTEAEPLSKSALAIREKQLGPEHPDTANSLNNLAELYRAQSKYEFAEPLSKRALAICEHQFGPKHLLTAISLGNLAKLYCAQGKYELAEPLSKRALAICEKQSGLEHQHTATSLLILAELYQAQSKYELAEPLSKRALAIYEKQLGPEHPNTATSLNNLAQLYRIQGKHEEAELLFQRALEIHEKQLETGHPHTTINLNNLAELYWAQGKYKEAEPLLQQTLTIYEKQLGNEHPHTVTSLNNLAALYRAQGKYSEAGPLHERALAIREQQLGSEHPDTATSLNNLAELYHSQGKYSQAEPLHERALAIREQQLGSEHPDTATSLNNLAELYRMQEKYEEAEPLYKRALAICEKQLGTEHPDTAMRLDNLAQLYRTQGKYEEAEPLSQRALEIHEKQLGTEHPHTAINLNNLALLYQAQKRKEEAGLLYMQALAVDEKVFGPEHPAVATDLNNLAELYRTQDKYEQAEPLLKRTLAIWEKTLGSLHPHTQFARENYAILLRAMGRDEEAKQLEKGDDL